MTYKELMEKYMSDAEEAEAIYQDWASWMAEVEIQEENWDV